MLILMPALPACRTDVPQMDARYGSLSLALSDVPYNLAWDHVLLLLGTIPGNYPM